MRATADNPEHCAFYEVLLDGVRLDGCIEADDVENWVRVFVKKPDGTLELDSSFQPVVELKTGAVEIRRIDQ